MGLHNLKPAEGSVKNSAKIIGRGQGSGKGGTATRGHKGAKSRSGYSKKVGFEGGQMPLQRRVPKFGFTNINRKDYAGVNLDVIQAYHEAGRFTDTITIEDLISERLVHKNDLVKILGRGDIKASVNISAHKFTATAKAAIEKVGGQAQTV
ncbi:50S ribosomal protein L15 [Nonlabens sp. MB-3u-79]|jgi:large subunit ribosomal protein L15|uniref:50S ribosomal protein L15 n=1 Tax=Nonlabens sp. MB-3u-79 TaxID=2058134 RepID=UPI000C31AED9|nr:50S ribosomal protein L15 [Nonlabens sp. MB-3u-79]AUC79222.1 50S ribosomal protein L15 [Nonlabens sp. MB-3u-79]|tara:strand:+ start:9289 stop:9741 length:453 start_codon:yes stop_codon:yes gene_type:complete